MFTAHDRRLTVQVVIATLLAVAGLLILAWGLYPLARHPGPSYGDGFKVVFPVQQRYADHEVRM